MLCVLLFLLLPFCPSFLPSFCLLIWCHFSPSISLSFPLFLLPHFHFSYCWNCFSLYFNVSYHNPLLPVLISSLLKYSFLSFSFSFLLCLFALFHPSFLCLVFLFYFACPFFPFSFLPSILFFPFASIFPTFHVLLCFFFLFLLPSFNLPYFCSSLSFLPLSVSLPSSNNSMFVLFQIRGQRFPHDVWGETTLSACFTFYLLTHTHLTASGYAGFGGAGPGNWAVIRSSIQHATWERGRERVIES